MLDKFFELINTYQTISIIFVSTFLTVICIASKKSQEAQSPTFNILQNETVVENDIEIISLDRGQKQYINHKSRIPIRKNQLKNDVINVNEKKLNTNNDIETISNNNNKKFNKPIAFIIPATSNLNSNSNNNNNNNNNNNTIKITPSPSSSINLNKNSRKQFKITSNEDVKKPIIKPVTTIKVEQTPNNEIEVIRTNQKPSINKTIPVLPVDQIKINGNIKPLNNNNNNNISNTSITSVNTTINNNSDTLNFSTINNNKINNGKTNFDISFSRNLSNKILLNDEQIIKNQIKKENNINTVNLQQQKNKETVPSTINPTITNDNINNTVNNPSSTNTAITTIPKVEQPESKIKPKKSNLANKKSNYKLLKNEINKKNKKSVQFHNKVEVWARTPTFLLSEKSFNAGENGSEFYDQYNQNDNLKNIKLSVNGNNRLLVPSNNNITVSSIPSPSTNSYTSKLRAKLAGTSTSTSVPLNQYTDSSIPIIPTTNTSQARPTHKHTRVSSFPVHTSSNNRIIGSQRSIEGGQHTFLYTPSPVPIQNDIKPLPNTITSTIVKNPVNKQVSSAPTFIS